MIAIPRREDLQPFLDSLAGPLQVDAVSIHLAGPQGLEAVSRLSGTDPFPAEVPRLCMQRGASLHLSTGSLDPGVGPALRRDGLGAVSCVPLRDGRGVLCVGRRRPVPLDSHERLLLEARAAELSWRLETLELRARLEESEADLEARVRAEGPMPEPADRNMASLSRMARQLGHDLRGPLANLRVALDLLRGADREDQERLLDRLDAEIGHASRLIADRVHLTRALEPSWAPTSLAAAARQASMELRRPSDVRLELAVEEAPTLEGDIELLARLMVLLAENSIEAMDGGGVVRLSATAVSGGGEIRVEDSGPGIPPELRERVLRPGFTTRERGSGLGLPICRRIVAAHGGTLHLEASPLGGAAVVVRLPARQEIPSAQEKPGTPCPSSSPSSSAGR